MKRLGESLDDGGRGKRIGGGFQVGPAEQVADASIELPQLGLALVLHHPDDVAGKNRFVHGGGVDQRQLVDLDLRKMLLGLAPAGYALVDQLAQIALEIHHQGVAMLDQDGARIEAKRLLFADTGTFGACHEQIADPVEQGCKRQQQPMNGQVPAIAENSGQILRHLTTDGPFAGSSCRGHPALLDVGWGKAWRGLRHLGLPPTRSPKARFERTNRQVTVSRALRGANVKNHLLSARKLRPGLFQAFV